MRPELLWRTSKPFGMDGSLTGAFVLYYVLKGKACGLAHWDAKTKTAWTITPFAYIFGILFCVLCLWVLVLPTCPVAAIPSLSWTRASRTRRECDWHAVFMRFTALSRLCDMRLIVGRCRRFCGDSSSGPTWVPGLPDCFLVIAIPNLARVFKGANSLGRILWVHSVTFCFCLSVASDFDQRARRYL